MSTRGNVAVESESKVDIGIPKLYKVIFHNDNKTTVEFVIRALMEIFHKDFREATEITMAVHHKGRGIAGVYTHEIAEQKTEETIALARSQGYPLVVTFEED